MNGIIPPPQTTPEPHKDVLTDEQVQDIGIIQMVLPVIMQNILAIMAMTALIYMTAVKYEAVPPEFLAICSLIIGYYFKK